MKIEVDPLSIGQLRQAVMAGWRLKSNGYHDWMLSGGPNECKHGIARGINCERCDGLFLDAMAKAIVESDPIND